MSPRDQLVHFLRCYLHQVRLYLDGLNQGDHSDIPLYDSDDTCPDSELLDEVAAHETAEDMLLAVLADGELTLLWALARRFWWYA